MSYYDYILVGSGIAGLYTALLAKEQGSVLILTKSGIEECNTRHAQGGIAAPIGLNDSAELHIKDTLAAGKGLCDEEAVRILATEAPDRIADLVKFGVPFDTLEGKIALTMEAAHSVPRILACRRRRHRRTHRSYPQQTGSCVKNQGFGKLPGDRNPVGKRQSQGRQGHELPHRGFRRI